MNTKIYLSSPHLGEAERAYVNEAFDSNWVAPLGPNVDGLERALQAYTAVPHAAALSSGTAALHLALIELGVGPGDYVACQSMTFSASANPIVYQGATPVFVDSEPETWNMDPNALEDLLRDFSREKKPLKAIIPVHLYGMPAQMGEIMALAERYGVPVIEDAAEALGSTWRGRKCGGLGNMGVLSFNGNKIITTSGGGALLSRDEGQISRARFRATQARDPAPHYQHSEIGYNYRMSNICAGIGRGQMEVLDERVAQRRANWARYRQYFSGWSARGIEVRFQEEPEGFFSNRWLSCVLVDPAVCGGLTRERLRLAFEAENIESRPLWKPMHLQPVFAGVPYYGGVVSERLFDLGLCLPSGSNLTAGEWARIEAVLDGCV